MTHALLLSSLLLFAPGDDSVLFEDSFDARLQTGWKWIREDADQWRIRDGALHMQSQPGGIWGGNNAKNVLILSLKETDHMEARVNVAHVPKKKWEQAGLLWYVDDDNFVKLISEHIDGKMYAVLASEEGGRGRVFGKIPMPQANVQLRMLIQSHRVTGQWRVKETDDWSDSGSCEFKVKGTPRFGLFTQTGPDNATRWVQYDKFVVVKTNK